MKQRKPVPPAQDELRAEAVVNTVLGTRRFSHDDQSEDGMVDFLLDPVDGVGPLVALEVSSMTEGPLQGLWEALNRHYDQPVPGLEGDWIVQFTPETNLKRAAGPLAALLRRQEKANLDRIGLNGWDDTAPPGPVSAQQHVADLQELANLKVVSAQRVRSDKATGRVFPTQLNSGVARSTRDTISPRIDTFLDSKTGENKVKKLARHSDREGHLFIWADHAHLDIMMSLTKGFLPTDSPNAPASLHTIWLGTFTVDGLVYRWNESGWSILDVARRATSR
ncbi:hypothetical protein ACFUEM_35615 [Streptomyces anulatus]|uniref:hypothetical protein n=1 Tax=Streptomyces anulatus TaxID=1892 RepID=UPI0035E0BE4A